MASLLLFLTILTSVVCRQSVALLLSPKSILQARSCPILRSSNENSPSEDDVNRLNALLGTDREISDSPQRISTPKLPERIETRKRSSSSGSLGINDESVPDSQQPAKELDDLKVAPLFQWAQLEDSMFAQELLKVYFTVFVFVSLPISLVTYDVFVAPLQAFAAANVGTTGLLCILLLRLWIGWSYVGDRLVKDVGYYEETGWYDGFLSVKPSDVRDRDKLLYEFEVVPALRRLRFASGAAAALFVLSIGLLLSVAPDDPYMYLNAEYMQSLRADDATAAREQLQREASGRPTYCDDRYYRAMSGGGGCR